MNVQLFWRTESSMWRQTRAQLLEGRGSMRPTKRMNASQTVGSYSIVTLVRGRQLHGEERITSVWRINRNRWVSRTRWLAVNVLRGAVGCLWSPWQPDDGHVAASPRGIDIYYCASEQMWIKWLHGVTARRRNSSLQTRGRLFFLSSEGNLCRSKANSTFTQHVLFKTVHVRFLKKTASSTLPIFTLAKLYM